MEVILERDGYDCVWCRRPLTMDSSTTDHLIPKLKGGPSWIENEVASCAKCNKNRGHTRPLDWLEQCEQVWPSNRDAIERGLQSLSAAIQERGGQRKARPYLQHQLKQLER